VNVEKAGGGEELRMRYSRRERERRKGKRWEGNIERENVCVKKKICFVSEYA
jgi:hypothetical protein